MVADVGDQDLDLRDIFGKDISRDLIGRLHARGLIATGPRSPRRALYVCHDRTVFGGV